MSKLQQVLSKIGPRTRKALRIVGYVVFAIVTFVFALQLTFPYDRVRERVMLELGKKYDVSIARVERSIIPGRMTFHNIILKTRPAQKDVTKAEEIEDPKERQRALALLVTTFYVESLEVDVDLLPLIAGKASVDIAAQIGSGSIAGNLTISKAGTVIDLEGDVAGERLPMRELVGLPISGELEFDIELDLPNRKNKAGKLSASWKHAEGELAFACPQNCVVGDGKTKLKMKVKKQSQAAFQGDGVSFGKVNIDSLVAKVVIAKGMLDLTKFETKSADGELHVDYQMTLEHDLDDSAVNGCLRFAGSEVLRKREPDTHSAFLATGALRGPDNLFHIRLAGNFKNMKRLPQSCGPGATGGAAEDNAPQLKIQPMEDPKPPPGDTATTANGTNGTTTAGSAQINPPPPAAPSDAAVAGSGSGSGSGPGPGSGDAVAPGNPAQPGTEGDGDARAGSGTSEDPMNASPPPPPDPNGGADDQPIAPESNQPPQP